MFRCEKCKNSAHRPNRIVTEYRMHQHVATGTGPRGGRGPQIVSEMRVCDECLVTTPAAQKPEPEPVEAEPLKAKIEVSLDEEAA